MALEFKSYQGPKLNHPFLWHDNLYKMETFVYQQTELRGRKVFAQQLKIWMNEFHPSYLKHEQETEQLVKKLQREFVNWIKAKFGKNKNLQAHWSKERGMLRPDNIEFIGVAENDFDRETRTFPNRHLKTRGFLLSHNPHRKVERLDGDSYPEMRVQELKPHKHHMDKFVKYLYHDKTKGL